MADHLSGLSDHEMRIVKGLTAQLRSCRPRNLLRKRLIDGKAAVKAMSPMLPPYLRRTGAVLGWPMKACEAVNRRVRLEGFDLPGGDISRYGLDQVLTENQYLLEVRQTQLSSLTHGVAWEIVGRGDTSVGEPEVYITSRSALDGTGEWNRRTRRLDSFLDVYKWSDSGEEPRDFMLYLPGYTVTVVKGVVEDVEEHGLPHIPVTPVVYRPTLDKPFGRSRLTRSMMFLTGAAVRALLRMEGTADFYGTPHILLLGALLEQFQDSNGTAASTWDFLMSKINAIPDDDQDAINPRAEVVQLQQGSQQPHMDSLDQIAAAFAGETGIPVGSLGVGIKQANPTSAESYESSREDLIGEAEDAQDVWGGQHVRTMQLAYMTLTGRDSLPPALRGLLPRFRDARRVTRSAAADATLKLTTAFPWMVESEAILENVGFDKATTDRLKADLAAYRASVMTTAANAGAGTATATDQPDEEGER